MTMAVFGYLTLISIDFKNFRSPFSPRFQFLIKMMYQTRKTVFDGISKHFLMISNAEQ